MRAEFNAADRAITTMVAIPLNQVPVMIDGYGNEENLRVLCQIFIAFYPARYGKWFRCRDHGQKRLVGEMVAPHHHNALDVA